MPGERPVGRRPRLWRLVGLDHWTTVLMRDLFKERDREDPLQEVSVTPALEFVDKT